MASEEVFGPTEQRGSRASSATGREVDRIVTAKERRELVPYSDMHIWRLEQAGRFPKRIRLGPHRVGWSLREVLAWLEDRKVER